MPFYRQNERLIMKRGRPPITAKTALLFSIWVMANCESFRGVADRFGIERGHGHRVFIYICKIFDKHLKNKYIRWPKGPTLNEKVSEFDNLRPNGMPGAIGCIDGTHIKIPAPCKGDNSYYNRKGYHSVLAQAVCDAKKQFLDVYCGWPGSANDARVWSNSPLAKYLSSEPCPIPDNLHLLGDSAYPLQTFLLCPYKDNGHLTRKQKNFNKKLSSTRVIIEQAFGLLKGRWRRLQYLDIKNIKYAKLYIMFACILHNITINLNDFIDCDFDEEEAGIDYHEEEILLCNEESRNQRLLAAQRKRDELMNTL